MADPQGGGRQGSRGKRRFDNADRRFRHGEWSVLAAFSGLEPGHLVISIPKRLVRCSVDRNAIKRQVREVYRNCNFQALPALDILLIRGQPHRRAGRVRRDERAAIREVIERLLRRVFDQAARKQGFR